MKTSATRVFSDYHVIGIAMRRGPNIPVEQRDEWARNAAEIASQGRLSDALRVLAKMYGVSQSTARNLISRGNYLAAVAKRTGGGRGEG